MSTANNSIIAVAPDGIGRAIVSESNLRDLMRSNVKKRKSRWEEDTASIKRGKYKGTRWGPESEKTFTPQPFSYLPGLPQEELEILIRRHRLDDIQRMLAIMDFETNDPDLRSLSPEPVYDARTGVRLNTREVRTKEKYTQEKNRVIEELMRLDSTFAPPADYRATKKIKKLYIPSGDTSVIGVIIGQKGQNQRNLEQKSGCRIAIRGKGASRNRIYNRTESDDNEPLHVLIQGDTDENIKKAVELIEPLIDPYKDPEKQGSHMLQLALRSVLRDEYCENCGEKGHKLWDCPKKLGQGWQKAEVCCAICKERSHPTSDCPLRRNETAGDVTLQLEFRRFMRELKGPDYDLDAPQPMSIKGRDDMAAIEYGGMGANGMMAIEGSGVGTGTNDIASVEALSRNVGLNQTLRTPGAAPAQPGRALAISDVAANNMPHTTFKGTTSNIKVENVIMLDANGNPIGSIQPLGSVSNPLMNPVYAAMYAPYLAAYNYAMQNPTAYYAAVPQQNGNSSLSGFPQMKPQNPDDPSAPPQ